MAKDKYYLYIDDSGWRYPDQEQAIREDGMDYFALGGILVKGSDRSAIIDRHEKFCRSWDISYPLHSSDIRGRRMKFSWLKDDVVNRKFNTELSELMRSIPAIGFAAVIDRHGYNSRYNEIYAGKPWWMCKTAFSILIDRTSKYIQYKGLRFKIIVEKSGPREDKAIVEYFRSLRREGLPFNPETSARYGISGPELFQQIPYGDPEFQTKKNPLLQLADLYLYPMVKGGYDRAYYPYVFLMEHKKLIDAVLSPDKIDLEGIKYSCFDTR